MIDFLLNVLDYLNTFVNSIWNFFISMMSLLFSFIGVLPNDISAFLSLTFSFGLIIGLVVFFKKIF